MRPIIISFGFQGHTEAENRLLDLVRVTSDQLALVSREPPTSTPEPPLEHHFMKLAMNLARDRLNVWTSEIESLQPNWKQLFNPIK